MKHFLSRLRDDIESTNDLLASLRKQYDLSEDIAGEFDVAASDDRRRDIMIYSLSLKEIQDVCPDFTGQKINIEISVLSKAIKNIMGEAADSFLLKNKSDFANIIKNTRVSIKE